ncbi:MAG: sulfatase-like hydrolase/transferase [Candidatus Omnitrophica bacterium]|nr:sulfatase-like hydrolase/transferase [Candidatus Omnitrophota bacterium]MCB9783750.1 sulfatase-like hydrolase/transferase [Candidatus Omnitrophota bacterium]
MKNSSLLSILWFLGLTVMTSSQGWGNQPSRPVKNTPKPTNLVVIMTDNHGAWTLGCYGNPDIRTPNIDRLAEEGARFTGCYSVNGVCSPTRASFLTGLLPCQHGVHCYLHSQNLQVGPKAASTLEDLTSLPEVLSEAGYQCGLVGKWHLGNNLEPQEGFSEWITMPHGATSRFYDAEIIENGEIKEYPGYLTDLWTERAVQFIETHQEKPFFLFLSYNGPYGLGGHLSREARNRHAGYYSEKELPSFPRRDPHPWLLNNRQFINNPVSIRRYASELSGVDDGVGEVLETLERLGLDENTLILFTADQGWVGGQGGFWGMGDHTRPITAYDGMLQVPLILRQPGRIPEETTSDILVSTYDLMPTVLSYLDLGEEMPKEPESPGRDFSGALSGEPIPWKNEVFYEFENTRAIRTDEWKYIERTPYGPDELYHVSEDPGEETNLIHHLDRRETGKELRARLHEFFDRYADPRYDLWKGGGSKTKLLVFDAKVVEPPFERRQ